MADRPTPPPASSKRPTPPHWRDMLMLATDKLMAALPPKISGYLKNLSLQQRRTAAIIAGGLLLFLIVWLVFSSLQQAPTRIISAKQLQIPSNAQGASTAITQPARNFPKQAGLPPAPVRRDLVDLLNLTPMQKSQLLELRQNVDNIYKNVLSFTLDEAKMIVFAQAATKIDMINAKWDTLIAGAPDEKLAIEYLTSATLESRSVLRDNQEFGIPEREYNEIYLLSARDANFNKIANAYKKLVAEGIWGPVTPLQTGRASGTDNKSVDPALRFPVAPPADPTNTSTMPTVPPAAGTAPVPVGSPATPYSPPPAR